MASHHEPRPIAGQSGFDGTRALLAERGLTETGASYAPEAFGSWWITVEHEPPLRIIWDGKDGWAIIDAGDSGMRESVWRDTYDLWIGKRPEDHTPEAVVKALDRLLRFAAEARAATR